MRPRAVACGVLAALVVATAFTGVGRAADPPSLPGPDWLRTDRQQRGWVNFKCGTAWDRIIALRARNSGITIFQGDAAHVQVMGPLERRAKTYERETDTILVDPVTKEFILVETSTGPVDGKYRSGQVPKDHGLVAQGGFWNGRPFRAKTAVYMIPRAPSPAVQADLTRRGLAFFAYLDGTNNFDQLPAHQRPSPALRRAIFRPLELPPMRLPRGNAPVLVPAGLAFINAATVVYGIYSEIKLGLAYADRAEEVNAKVDAALEEVRRATPQGKPVRVRVTLGGDKAGPFANAVPQGCGTPTLTTGYVHVVNDSRPCQPGQQWTVNEPAMHAPGQQFYTYETCLLGTGDPCLANYEMGFNLARQKILPPHQIAVGMRRAAEQGGCLTAFDKGQKEGWGR